MKYSVNTSDDLIIGLLFHGIVSLVFASIMYLFLGIFMAFICFVGMMYLLFKTDFEVIPKDHLASIVSYSNRPLFNKGAGYFWKMFGLRKMNHIYDATIDVSVQALNKLLTADEKEVACKFQTFTQIEDPLLLEETLGYDNFEEELEAFRKNQFEEYVRGVELSTLETAKHDDLKRQREKIVTHHHGYGIKIPTKKIKNENGIEVEVADIEVFDIQPTLAKEREDVQKEKYRQEVEEVKREKLFNRVSRIYFQNICRFGNKTEQEYFNDAKNILGNDAKNDLILMKAIKLAELNVPDEKERARLYNEALRAQQLHEGKRSESRIDYNGLGKAKILVGAGK